MADQCIVCLEPLEVESSAAPPGPAEQQHIQHQQLLKNLKDLHQRLAIEDPDALAKINEKGGREEHDDQDDNSNNVAEIQACGHMLHDTCLREWTDKANSCPICRQVFNVVSVYDKIGGRYLSTRRVEDKKQVVEFDPRAWADEPVEELDLPVSRCPVCNQSGDEEVLLLCDGCDAAYHTHCIDLDSVPSGPWFCMECVDAFGPDVIQPVDNAGAEGGAFGQSYYFPRTQASMRRARQRARSDEWQGAWGQITGRIWDALEIDVDYNDEEDADVFEGLRRSRQLRERERREHERWQQRLNIASRMGARDVFANNMPGFVPRPPPTQQSREEQLAWGALEKARDMESRKRKSRSATAEPHEEPHHEPERKLKRPRTRRLPPQNGESSASAASSRISDAIDRQPQQGGSSSSSSSRSAAEAPPSFLASLLKEVEMSTPSDEESLRNMFGPIPSVNDAPSPARSPSLHSQGSVTPPPNRSSSPRMTLSSHIGPKYPAPGYSPTRGSSSSSVQHSRSSSPSHRPAHGDGQSSPENSDSEPRGRRRHQPGHHGTLELRQPQPRRSQNVALPRSQHTSPARQALPREMKESISRIVRGALKPHWRSSRLTAEQYESINRDISRKIYDEVKDPGAVSEEMKQGWERIATQEVARAVASLKA